MAKGNKGRVLKAGSAKESGNGIVSSKQAAGSAADAALIEVVHDNTDKVLREMPTAINRALEAIGLLAEGHVIGYITEHHIVDTGRLRNSVTHAVDGGDQSVIVGTNVEYAPYVHEGVHGKPGRPFLTEPIQQHQSEYREVFDEQMKGA
jgi:phage gpG-like protein